MSLSILYKRKTPSTCKYLKDKPIKKLKVSSFLKADFKNIPHCHLGFIWKSLIYIKERNILIATGTEGTITLFDAGNRFQYMRTITAYKHLIIYSVVYVNSLNAIACSSTDHCPIRIFNIDNGELLFELSKEREYFNFLDLVYLETINCLIAGGFDQNLLFFDLKSQKQMDSVAVGHPIGAIKYIKHANLAIMGLWGGEIKAVNLASKRIVFSKQAHTTGYTMCLQVIENQGMMVSCGDDGKILLWSLKKTVPTLIKRISVFDGYHPQLRNLVKIDERYLIFEYDSNLVMTDIFNGKRLCAKRTKEELACMLWINQNGLDALILASEKLEYIRDFRREFLSTSVLLKKKIPQNTLS